MTTLSIVAAGIIAAAALSAFAAAAPRNAAPAESPAPNPHRRADQRGITLQTLIIMAVLVVIAAGVSVVLVGVTRGANDRLGDAGKVSSEAKCEPWELYDPEYATAGIGSPTGKGGVWSSGTGCIRVCHARFQQAQTNPVQGATDIVLSYENEARRRIDSVTSVASLEFHRGEKISLPVSGAPVPGDPIPGILTTSILTIGGSQEFESYTNGIVLASRNAGVPITPVIFSFTKVITDSSQANDPIPIGDLEIRVASDLRSCVLWDPATGKEIFRSQGII